MKFVVTGSLGNISRPLTETLVRHGHSVTVISSNAARQAEIESMGAHAAIGTMTDPDFLARSFAGADAVYVMEAVGYHTFFDHSADVTELVKQIARCYKQAIEASGVKRVVHLSSIGAHTSTESGILAFHYYAEQILNELPADVSIRFMRPVGFYNNMYSFIKTISTQNAIISNYGGDEKEPWVSPIDIAAAIAAEMEQPFEGRTVRYIASDEVSPVEVAQALGTAIGRPGLEWREITDEQYLQGLLDAGMNPATARGYTEMNAARRGGILYKDYNSNRPVLGATKLTTFAREFAVVYQKNTANSDN